MSKYTEIHPDGQRAYQFVADTAYVRESGTKGEHKAAEYILKEAEQAAAQLGKPAYIQTPRMEFFQCPDFQQKKAELVICQPYKDVYKRQDQRWLSGTANVSTCTDFPGNCYRTDYGMLQYSGRRTS